jgi:predicted transcriptional regulator
MMPTPPRPTEAELAVLRVLWDRGPSSVREIHQTLAGRKDTVYTTTLKIVQKMHEKGLVVRDDSRRSHVFAAAFKAEQTQRQLLRDLVDRAFAGATSRLVVRALEEKRVSPAELAEIRGILDQLAAAKPNQGRKK